MVVRNKPAKKQRSENGGAEARSLAVVIEEQRAHFKVFGEALQGLRDEMGVRFEAVDRRFEAVDRRFDAVDRRFDAVDRRFDAVDQRLDGLYTDLSLVKVAVLETNRGITELRRSVEDLDARKVDRDELHPPAG